MKNTRKNNIRLGSFVGIGIIIFILGIYYIGSQRNIFSKNFMLSGVFKDISGTKIGNDVRFSGINIGTVSKVEILSDSLVQIVLSVQQDVQQFIRKDSKMEIVPEGLMGIKVVNIYSGTNKTGIVEDGDILETIEAVQIDKILRQLNTSSLNTTIITKNVAEITDKINRGEGAFGKIFADESFAANLSKISEKTALLTENFAEITDKISKEKGTVGMLLSDTTLAKKIFDAGENLQKSTENLVKITDQVNSGQGLFGEIFTDTTFTSGLSRAGKNLDYTTEKTKILSDNLVKITDEINEGQGLITRLIYDTAFADSVEIAINNVNKSAKEVEEAAKVVKRNWLIRLFSKKDKKK
ncbi:MAG: MCE family protein [Bacteroidales bacterium]|nr:MCE family protein [Bacteroidales bacterium]